MFFLEGAKVLFKVALAILNLSFSNPKSNKEVSGFFELTRKLRNLPIEVTFEETLIPEVRASLGGESALLSCVCGEVGAHHLLFSFFPGNWGQVFDGAADLLWRGSAVLQFFQGQSVLLLIQSSGPQGGGEGPVVYIIRSCVMSIRVCVLE